MQGAGDHAEIERTGEPVDQRHAVQQCARGDRAEDEILHGRFGAHPRVAVERHQRVHRQRQQLDAEVHRQQRVGGHQHEDAEQRGERQHVVFAAQDVAVLQVGARIQQRHRDDQECGELEHKAELVGDVHAGKQQRAPADVRVEHGERRPGSEGQQRERRGQAAVALAGKHVDQQDHADRAGEPDLRDGGSDAARLLQRLRAWRWLLSCGGGERDVRF